MTQATGMLWVHGGTNVTDQTPLHGTDWDPLLGHEFGKEYWICWVTK